MAIEETMHVLQKQELQNITLAAVEEFCKLKHGLSPNHLAILDTIVYRAVLDASEVATKYARDERDLVDEMTQEVLDRRHAYTVQATIASIMKAAEVEQITLTLDDISHVFKDHELRLGSFDLTNGITYRLVNRESPHV